MRPPLCRTGWCISSLCCCCSYCSNGLRCTRGERGCKRHANRNHRLRLQNARRRRRAQTAPPCADCSSACAEAKQPAMSAEPRHTHSARPRRMATTRSPTTSLRALQQGVDGGPGPALGEGRVPAMTRHAAPEDPDSLRSPSQHSRPAHLPAPTRLRTPSHLPTPDPRGRATASPASLFRAAPTRAAACPTAATSPA